MEKEREQGKEASDKVKRALAGVKVVEWSQFIAGPYCAKLMADLGAEVIKVEEPGAGDEARRRGPFPKDVPHPERSALFLYLNTNKKGITLSLEKEAAKEIFKKLIQETDILVEDKPPLLMEKLGLNYEKLKEINPRLIMTSITPFGQTGPYRDYKAYHLNTFHGSGFGYLTPGAGGDPDILKRPPIMMGGFLAEYQSGVTSAIATLAALYVRRMIGVGQHIDVSKLETPLLQQKDSIARYRAEGEVMNRASGMGAATWGGLTPCKDGYLLMGGHQPHQIAAIFDMMGNPEWSKDEKFKPEVFHEHSAEARPYILEWAAERYKDEIWHIGQEKGAPMAAIYTVGEVMNVEHLKVREFFVDIEHPEAGNLPYPSVPYRLSETPAAFEHPAPLLGEHNKAIYNERLGYSQQDLTKMKQEGII